MIPEEKKQPMEEKELPPAENADGAAAPEAASAPVAEENTSTIYTASTFPTTKPRRRSALKRQRKLLVILLAVAILLGAIYIPVSLLTDRQPVRFEDGTRLTDADGTKYYTRKKDGIYMMFAKGGSVCETTDDGLYKTKDQVLVTVDETTGKASVVAVPLMEGTEDKYFNAVDGTYDILLYPMIGRSEVQSIEVKNKKDHFKFVKDKEGAFYLEGHPETPYNSMMFATLLSLTGYTNTVARLDLSESNPDAEGFRQNGYAEYGLPENTDDAENYFVITTTDGVTHRVCIGNVILDDTGYYARYAGRDQVYVLQQLEESDYNSTLSGTLLTTLESYVTPTVTTTISSTNYFDVTDFTILGAPGNSTDLEDFEQVVKFSYEPVERRKNTFYANIPYFGQGKLSGYAIDDYQADVCLQYIMDLSPLRTVKLFRDHTDTEKNLQSFVEEYGVAYAMEFTFNGSRKGEEGDWEPVRSDQVLHQIWVSPLMRNEDGIDVYYMYNEVFDMIVEVARTSVEFLEWDDYKWVNSTVFNGNIGYLDKMEISIKGGTTAGVTGVTNVLFDISYVDDKGNPIAGMEESAQIQVFATYGGIQNKKINDTLKFRYFYQSLLASNLEGSMPKGSEAVQEALKGTEPDLKITLTFETGEETVVRTYCFYSGTASSGRGAYMTLNGNGNFYMLQGRVNKIINDIGKALSENEADTVDPDAKS
ncbi:MAG: hypothetical protein E7590_07385 [Ruminococcaceae bacterium]|nr:hypothetical protein [Oscillospiraceae bacterium]